MPVTRMDHRIEALESVVVQIQPLGNAVVGLKGDLEHLNARLGMELSKLNDKIEASLAVGRKELNEGLQILAKMIKGIPQESTGVTDAGSEMKSTASITELTGSKPGATENIVICAAEGSTRRRSGNALESWVQLLRFQLELKLGQFLGLE
ncbi:Hypothetical predicted protein [Olea europaea subsp. europaea]|uniref:Uncharacterized protein n=1 Tax=Olea europaea subsp. europaea TaxID=158383 RepID=A0A8S0PDE0_OLEEU|nr:Hypothetical predicted protein [Olea europaea subsp. europaea]